MPDNNKSSSNNNSNNSNNSNKSSFRDSKFAKLNQRYNNSGSFSLIIKILFGILILAVLIRYYVAVQSDTTPVYPTFRSLLKWLSDFPDTFIPYVSVNLSNWLAESAWGIFDVFKPVIQVFVFFHDLLMFTINAFLNVITVVIFIFSWLFTG